MKEQMVLTDNKGNEITCEVVAKFNLDGKDYIAYTDGTTNDGLEELYLSAYKKNGEEIKLDSISEEEWDRVNSYLTELLDEEDDYE